MVVLSKTIGFCIIMVTKILKLIRRKLELVFCIKSHKKAIIGLDLTQKYLIQRNIQFKWKSLVKYKIRKSDKMSLFSFCKIYRKGMFLMESCLIFKELLLMNNITTKDKLTPLAKKHWKSMTILHFKPENFKIHAVLTTRDSKTIIFHNQYKLTQNKITIEDFKGKNKKQIFKILITIYQLARNIKFWPRKRELTF